MTSHGGKLADIEDGALRSRLRDETDAKAIKRLVAAIEYKDGLSPARIEEKYGWPEQTTYEWLDRFESRGIDGAIYDTAPPGRPARLSPSQRHQLREVLAEPPTAAGFEAATWTIELGREYIETTFDVEYSASHVSRIIRDLASQTGAELETWVEPGSEPEAEPSTE